MFLTQDDAKTISDRLLALSKAQSCTIRIDGGEEQSLRFAGGGATTNVATRKAKVRIDSHIGGRTGSVAVAGLEPEELARALARSEEIARLLPTDPEFMEPLGPQNYAASRRYDESTASLPFDDLGAAAARAIAEGEARGMNMYGCAASGRRFAAMATSNGLFAYDRTSEIDLSSTARNRADSWSGWAGAHHFSATRLDATAIGRRAAEKAAQMAEPLDLEPGRYTVILEPVAVGELARWLLWMMNGRTADEGRSFFSAPGGGTKLGAPLFHKSFTIRSAPEDPEAAETAFGDEGLPQRSRHWVENGVLRSLSLSRYWAAKTDREPIPVARSFVVEGGETSLEAMIAGAKRAILVTRLWYANLVDPRGLLLTGLTRDGNFLVENGRVVGPVRNMRFNQSLASAFSRIAAVGPSERVFVDMSRGAAIGAPPMVIEGFEFSSRSSGI